MKAGAEPVRRGLHPLHRPPTRSSPPLPPERRLVGLDLARGLAVLGMFAAHVGPDFEDGPAGAVLQVTHGRSAALFALLAGVTMMIISGRRRPKTGREGRQAAVKIAIRAVILIALGTALAMLPTPVDAILAYYGLLFLLALPLVRLRARTLAIIAAVLAVVGPLLSYGLLTVLNDQTWAQSWQQAIDAHDPIKRLCDTGVLDLLLTGTYPAMTWMPYIVSGMALGRLDLQAARVRHRLAALGAALALVGYGTSYLVYHAFPAVREALATSGWYESGPPTWWQGPESGTVDTSTPALLLVAAPHSGTSFEVIGNTGVAIAVIAGAFTVLQWSRAHRLLHPLIAAGTMSLTLYTVQIIVLAALDSDDSYGSLHVLSVFVVTALVSAVLWTRHFRRGPLEYLVNTATRAARHVR
ncbi:DUF418 domain-containing protein [Actinomadura rugatobispora]|uniref:DUF418 domain-containing protein n=1 Tax=Actinomadura rugatobispora TaxID=1994 RepID=A0ABW1A4V1_9ACTN|nr:heparan-alpha-glucosaminide N-acetyltransferase domain-containing protein [Actinomadura rugatobispora]